MSDLLSEDDAGAAARKFVDLARLKFEFRTYYLLFFALLAVSLAIAAAAITVIAPIYTATALVGPADNSDQPFGMGAAGVAAGVGGLAKHLHVGGMLGQNGDDTFNEYTSLLTSTRLASVLVDKDHILPEVFNDQWDMVNKRWYPRDSAFDRAVDFAKRLLRRPVKPAPDVDDLTKYFEANLNLDVSLETSFATVTLKFKDPAAAERILHLILLEADNIIRQDKRRDVSARISYLNDTLARLNLADQKPELIDILSDQQQEMMMIESDHRYASVLIDPPHAPLKPTSPVPTIDAAMAFAFACLAWLGAVRLTPQSGGLRRLLEIFARPGARRPRSHSGVAAKARTPVSS
jgi:hypothetical protein